MFVDKVRFEQEFLPKLLMAHPKLSPEQVIIDLEHDIFAERIPLHVPGLVGLLRTWVIVEAAGFRFDHGSVVVDTPMLSNVDTDAWLVHFHNIDYSYVFRAPDLHAWAVSRYGATSASTVNIAQHVGPQNIGSVTQNVGPFYINTVPSTGRPSEDLAPDIQPGTDEPIRQGSAEDLEPSDARDSETPAQTKAPATPVEPEPPLAMDPRKVTIEVDGVQREFDPVDLSGEVPRLLNFTDKRCAEGGHHRATVAEIDAAIQLIAASAPDGLTSEETLQQRGRHVLRARFQADTTASAITDRFDEAHEALRRPEGSPLLRRNSGVHS
jgi:hypothetical protein